MTRRYNVMFHLVLLSSITGHIHPNNIEKQPVHVVDKFDKTAIVLAAVVAGALATGGCVAGLVMMSGVNVSISKLTTVAAIVDGIYGGVEAAGPSGIAHAQETGDRYEGMKLAAAVGYIKGVDPGCLIAIGFQACANQE